MQCIHSIKMTYGAVSGHGAIALSLIRAHIGTRTCPVLDTTPPRSCPNQRGRTRRAKARPIASRFVVVLVYEVFFPALLVDPL